MISNKRGQGLSTNAIILIILGIVVLVVLIAGFTVGWGKLTPWLSSDNVDTIRIQCETACSTSSTYDFCSKTRELKADDKKIETNCATFSVISGYAEYGIEKCPSINCDFECEKIKIGEERQGVEKADACDPTISDDITSIAKIDGAGMKFCCINKLSF